MAHLVQHPVLTVTSQMPVENSQAGPEHRSTLPSSGFQQLVSEVLLLVTVKAEHSHRG